MKNVRNAAPAFTLIEIMIVVAIIGVVMATGLPAFRSAIRRDGMVKTVMDFKEACGAARRLAILDGAPMELRISPKNGTFNVGPMTRDIVPGSTPPDTAQVSRPGRPMRGGLPMQPMAGVQMPGVGGETLPPVTGTSGSFSQSVRIEMLDVNFLEYKDAEVARVRFYPNGTCDEMTLILQSSTGDWKKVTLEAVTALADVDDVVR